MGWYSGYGAGGNIEVVVAGGSGGGGGAEGVVLDGGLEYELEGWWWQYIGWW